MANVTLDGILIIAYHDGQFYWSWYIQYMEKDHTLDSHYSLPVGQLRNAPSHELNYLKTKNNGVETPIFVHLETRPYQLQ
jgi:hypothetical protein